MVPQMRATEDDTVYNLRSSVTSPAADMIRLLGRDVEFRYNEQPEDKNSQQRPDIVLYDKKTKKIVLVIEVKILCVLTFQFVFNVEILIYYISLPYIGLQSKA